MTYLFLSLKLLATGMQAEKSVVESYSKPLIRYNDTEVILDLDEVSLEFRQGLIGMKEGDKRTLYLDLEPVEVELIKADATFETHAATALEDCLPKNFF